MNGLQAAIDARECKTHAEVEAVTSEYMSEHFEEFAELVDGEMAISEESARLDAEKRERIISDSQVTSYNNDLKKIINGNYSAEDKRAAMAAKAVSDSILATQNDEEIK